MVITAAENMFREVLAIRIKCKNYKLFVIFVSLSEKGLKFRTKLPLYPSWGNNNSFIDTKNNRPEFLKWT